VLAELNLESHRWWRIGEADSRPYKLVSRELHPHDTIVKIGGVAIGGRAFAVIAGPCASKASTDPQHRRAGQGGGRVALRAGAYKPRTSPYGFQGHGPEGLRILRQVSEETGLPIVTEVMDTADVDIVAEHADALQIGARNIAEFRLAARVGKAGKPVLLKRGLSAKIEELLLAAEYLLAAGNEQ